MSEIKERLSPNIDPPTTMPSIKGSGMPICAEMPTAMGASAAMVPHDVPIAIDMKQDAKKILASIVSAGSR